MCRARGWDKARNCAGVKSSDVVWRAGKHKDGSWSVEATECPHRLTTAESEACVAWFLRSMRFNGFSPIPDPKPEWPQPGGLHAQSAKLVEAFDVLRMEMRYVATDKADK